MDRDRASRRSFLSAAGTAAAVGVAGCASFEGPAEETGSGNGDGTGDGSPDGTATSSGSGDADGDRTLVVGTYGAFIDAPSTSPGAWLKDAFEAETGAELVWQTPPNGLNYYIERHNAGVDVEADLYLGLNPDDMVHIDENAEGTLFAQAGDVEGRDDVKPGLDFDPNDRAIPYDTGYISLVYDGTATEAPETFEGLLAEEHRGDLIAQAPGSDTGRAFLLHTIHEFGADGEYDYLDYWADLQANDVRVLGTWSDAYDAWSAGEAPMVVSYSTDQVFAAESGADLQKHQIRFLNDQGYANPEGMATFADAADPELAREFMSFVLRPEIQGGIARRNVQFPATETAELPDDYADLAHEPPEPVTFTYAELQGSLDGWIDDWERQFAGGN
ncbi:thiamine ABC transporter substrate-binding protein [Halopenitus persicus]|uniref:Thiamine transport system substrate-binding protein n=1 Tax=Halopenitus persicus TaxID=1048396 RepID=A0A1H3FV00_9EURY|nr:thiamine ABC transporter substrate-binding protein [Halopenitus persicus]SDX93959.1 thiamine transport system substrate-binding protein [Halopenitus persicus]